MGQSGMPPQGPLVYQDHEHLMAVCGNAILTYSVAPPNPSYLAAWTSQVGIVVEQWQAPLLVMTIIGASVRGPDDESKRTIKETLVRHGAHIHAFAYVVAGEGFKAAAVRSAISLISLAARYSFPIKVFECVEDSVPWMLSRPSPTTARAPKPNELIQAAHSLSDQLKAIAAAS
ncbi:MAG TPA: hypothetical protein VEQ58_12585 [Polyangiaceae bacterium]|nr:hypothetical protein [Polyangiaceae bacterium]